MARKSRKKSQHEIQEAPKAIKHATWGYARISNEDDKSADSIEGQIAIIQDYAADKPDLDMKGVIKDVGFSGTDFRRPGYVELLDGIERGEVQCVVVKDLSRLGRAYIEVGELLFDTFPAYNVRFISVNDQYDSYADDAARKKLLILFKNLINHMYSKDLGVKIRSSHALKQQRGELLGSMPPYGYLFTTERGGKRLKIEPESAEVVKLIFDMRAQGNSMVKIANHLNQAGIRAPRNHYYHIGFLTHEKDAKKALWQNGYIGQLLRNEVYIGCQIQGKYERRGKKFGVKSKSEWVMHENAHPAIIEKTQFDTVQGLLAEAGVKYKKLGNKLDENIFVGKAFCSRCGKSLKRQHYRKNKNEISYRYVCRDCSYELRHSLGLEKISGCHIDKLSEIVTALLQKHMDTCIDIGELITKASCAGNVINKRKSLASELSRLQRESKKADDLLATAYTHHLAGILDSHEFELAREKFERDKNVAVARAEQVSHEAARYDIDKTKQNAFLTNFQRHKGFSELDKGIIHALIHRIEISPLSSEIHVILNYMDELGELNKLVEESGVLADVR